MAFQNRDLAKGIQAFFTGANKQLPSYFSRQEKEKQRAAELLKNQQAESDLEELFNIQPQAESPFLNEEIGRRLTKLPQISSIIKRHADKLRSIGKAQKEQKEAKPRPITRSFVKDFYRDILGQISNEKSSNFDDEKYNELAKKARIAQAKDYELIDQGKEPKYYKELQAIVFGNELTGKEPTTKRDNLDKILFE